MSIPSPTSIRATSPGFKKITYPTSRKKLSLWTQMLPQLEHNSAYRLKQNKDYALFLKPWSKEKKAEHFNPYCSRAIGESMTCR